MIQWVSGAPPYDNRERLAGSLNDRSEVRCTTQAGGTLFFITRNNQLRSRYDNL